MRVLGSGYLWRLLMNSFNLPPKTSQMFHTEILSGKKLALSFLFVLSAIVFSVAQENLTITGKVIDEDTKAPLSFASLKIIGKPVGTVTNADGEFDFYIPPIYAEDT